MARDQALEDAHAAWLKSERPRAAPRSSRNVLRRAEERLRGALAHGAPRADLEACAERVRCAWLGVMKADARVYDLPTDHGDPAIQRHREHLAAEHARWQAMTIDEILARYR